MPVVIEPAVPEALTRATPVPAWHGTTNRDMADWTLALLAGLRACNADKAAIARLTADAQAAPAAATAPAAAAGARTAP